MHLLLICLLLQLCFMPLQIFCRGCNEPTAHSAYINKREVPLCPR
jgi:hypothetical protein